MTYTPKYFASVADMQEFLPPHLRDRTIADWVKLSRTGDFAPVFQLNGGIFFRKVSVWKYALRTYQAEHRHLLEAMTAAGWAPTE